MRGDRARTVLPLLLAAGAVAGQIAYPLTHGQARDDLTIAIVVLVAAASAAHASLTRGERGVACVLVTAVGGFGVEVLGVHTGFPFGSYGYADTLGPRLWGVPLLLGAAWTMLAWPAALVARRLANSFVARVAVGAWALAAWDVFLDPQMVSARHWTWRHATPHLPGVPHVPLTNYAGWLLVSFALSAALQGILGSSRGDDAVPVALYLWTYVGSIVALLAFLDLRAAALWGALAMGIIVVPLVRTLPAPHKVRAHAHAS
jgi:putative membrane protein